MPLQAPFIAVPWSHRQHRLRCNTGESTRRTKKLPSIGDISVAFGNSSCAGVQCYANGPNMVEYVDYAWSEWSSWSTPCSAACGGGTQFRTRVVTQPSAHQSCAGNLVETRLCNTAACPADIVKYDCKMSQWSDWGACTQICGSGLQLRSRSVVTAAALGGMVCPAQYETRPCGTAACPATAKQCCAQSICAASPAWIVIEFPSSLGDVPQLSVTANAPMLSTDLYQDTVTEGAVSTRHEVQRLFSRLLLAPSLQFNGATTRAINYNASKGRGDGTDSSSDRPLSYS